MDRWGSWMAVRPPFDRKVIEDGPWSDLIHDWAAILQERRVQMEKQLDKMTDNPFVNPPANPFMVTA